MKLFFILSLVSTMLLISLKSDDVLRFSQQNTNDSDVQSGKVCPNKRTKCQNSQTCCSTKHNSFHCCKYRNAVCCSDKYHCCPEDSECDMRRKRCNRNSGSKHPLVALAEPAEWPLVSEQHDSGMLNMVRTIETIKYGTERLGSMCPNKKTKCKDTKTCCITKSGNYYCCPHKNAVCCPDKYHCCPENSKCDPTTNKCSNPNWATAVLQYRLEEEATKVKVTKFCENSKQKCPGKKRCCDMAEGKFGCCKYNKGVCCPDLKTCCPHDTACNVKNHTCVANPLALGPPTAFGGVKVVTPELAPANPLAPESRIQRKSLLIFMQSIGLRQACPDKQNCPEGTTCCSLNSGNTSYGCCPYNKAICCPDKKSCCPHGTKCIKDGCV